MYSTKQVQDLTGNFDYYRHDFQRRVSQRYWILGIYSNSDEI